MKFIKKLPVILLGLIFVIFSIQFAIMMIKGAAMPPMNVLATQFMGVWFVSGLVFIIKAIEFVCGVMLLIPRTRALALILIAPITVAILLIEILVVKAGFLAMIPALLIFIFNVIGIYQYRAKYLPIVR